MIDRNSQFLAILTNVGAAKLANANALGIPWNLTAMGVGDANDTNPMPIATQTKLINEQRRAPLNQLRVDPANAAVIIAEQVIPADVGGWWVREIGLYDADGDPVAVANCAPSYKSLLAQGSGRTQIVRMNFIVSSIANIVLKIDPAIVLATREYVDLAITEAMNKQDFKHSVLVATTANIVLSGLQTIDGVLLTAGARVLVKNQAQAKDNGLYVVPEAGAWTRAQDADASVEVTPGLFVSVETGTANGDSVWQLVTDAPIVLGTTALAFEMVAGRTGVSAGSYTRVTVDKYGRVIAGVTHSTLGGYGITDALSSTPQGVWAGAIADIAKHEIGTYSSTTTDRPTSGGIFVRYKYPGANSLAFDLYAHMASGADALGFRRVGSDGAFVWREIWHTGNFSPANYIPVAGGSYRPKFSNVGVSDNVNGINLQGGYVGWGNAEGGLTGAMHFVCNRGTGDGGFAWRSVNAENSQSGPAMKYSYDGWLSVTSLAVGANTTVPTAPYGDNSKKIASTEYVIARTAQYPVREAITAVGLSGGDKNQPYMRHEATGDVVMLQPLKAKDTALLTTNGWSKNADTGEIIQWCEYAIGDAQGATSSITVTWPFQFPAQCLNIRMSFRVASGSPGRMIASSYTLTTSGTTILLEEATTAVQSGLVLMIEVRGN